MPANRVIHNHCGGGKVLKSLKILLLCITCFLAGAAFVWWAFPKLGLPLLGTASLGRPLASVLAHPVYTRPFICSEHPAGQLAILGDDVGQDCLIVDFVTTDGRTWAMPYQGNGAKNEDWFGWGATVHSPCDCEVLRIHPNQQVNHPGKLGNSRAAGITLRSADGVHFVLAHLGSFAVEVGQSVRYGQAIGTVGNNGFSRSPHVHIGAWKGREGLQIRWDQQHMVRE
jgi:hypothetical protein